MCVCVSVCVCLSVFLCVCACANMYIYINQNTRHIYEYSYAYALQMYVYMYMHVHTCTHTHTHTHTLPVGNTKFLLSFILSAGLAFRSCARPGYDSRTLFPRLRTFKHAQCFPQSAVHFSTFQLKLCGFFPLFFFLPSFVPLGKYVVMRTIEADVFISVQILIILSGGYDNKIN